MSEICYKCAITLFNNGYEVYELHEDGTESLIMFIEEITEKKLYGVE